MREFHVLFTGVGRRIELLQAFRQAALVLNTSVKIYGADMAGTAPALAYCDYTRRVCGMREPEYIDQLLKICSDDKIDILIPTIDTDLLILSENRERFTAIGTKVLISAPDKISICRDKNLTSRFFVDCGLAAPMPVNDWTKYCSGFPAFIKPKDGSSSVNAFKVNDIEELEMYAGQVEDYIVQPFVDGREYTIDIFCDFDGNPVSIVPRERVAVRAGEVLKTKITLDPVMIEESKALCREFKPCGPLTVQLIRDKNSGVDYYIEINPRFGGGAPLSMKAGAKSAESIIKLVKGEVPSYCDNINDGAIYSRFDQSVCISEGSYLTLKALIFDLDDTLYSEKEYIRSGYRAVANYLGNEDYALRLWELFELGVPAIDALLKELDRIDEKSTVLHIYRSHMPELSLYDGVAHLLTKLRAKGIKLGIITDGRPVGQRNKIKALGLEELVDDIIVTDELGGEQFRKPCDIAFRILQTRWKLHPDEIAYVGDNLSKDFQAPNQLGMKSFYFRNKDGIYIGKEEPSVLTIESIADVENYL